MKSLFRYGLALPLLSSLHAPAEDITETILVTADRVASEGLDLPLAWSLVDQDALRFDQAVAKQRGQGQDGCFTCLRATR